MEIAVEQPSRASRYDTGYGSTVTTFYSNDPTSSLLPGASFCFLPLARSEDRRTPELRGSASDAVDCSGEKDKRLLCDTMVLGSDGSKDDH
eukprot:scaffold40326_cov36-Cyclotella_meneghiniana.AAC.1